MSADAGSPEPGEDHRPVALVAALVEVERHVGRNGWDQPPRLFALVLTDVLAAAEPALAADLGLRSSTDGGAVDALTAVEQEHFQSGDDLGAALAELEWPETVHGCALSLERNFLPARLEAELPDDPDAAARFVAAHPEREEIRVVVGADRSGGSHGVARLRRDPGELLGGPDLVPDLQSVLAHTLA